jgi:2-polyprenyl-3-methyl-5-hydroxy-6-metoxy-1,4-benzoquinol methylase
MDETKEPQYQGMVAQASDRGLEPLGLMTSYAWNDDPKRLTFTLSRYKFAAKMLTGRKNVLEVGCADAFGTRIVVQAVQRLSALDFDPLFVADVKKRMNPRWSFDVFVHDMLSGPAPNLYDGIFALDVLEHIMPDKENIFIANVVESLDPHGVVLFGSPSLESQAYASPNSVLGHVNCKSLDDFKSIMEKYFHNVFMFCMNDEVVHTGYARMAHYLFALACTPKKPTQRVAPVLSRRKTIPYGVSFVVTAFNEERLIDGVVRGLWATASVYLETFEIIVVDDASTDRTGVIADGLGREVTNIRVIHNRKNLGFGGSYRQGVTEAKFDYVMLFCGDGGLPASSVPPILEKVGTADMIVPYMLNLKRIKTPFRYAISRAYTELLNLLFGYRLRYYNGLAVHRRALLNQIGISSAGFGFQAEVILKLLKSGYTIVEVGVDGAELSKRSSAFRLKNILSVARTFIYLVARLRRFDRMKGLKNLTHADQNRQ